MRSIRAASAIFAAALALAGCPSVPEAPRFTGRGSVQPVRGGTLRLWEEARVRVLDPHIAFDQISGVLVTMLFDSLYGYDEALQLVPSIAAELPRMSEDGRTLVISLKHGVRFHHGREVRAEDVVWSLERMLAPDLHSPGAPYFRGIEGLVDYREKRSAHVRGLRVVDAYTVEIALEQADQSFVHALALRFAAPLPREEVERSGSDMRRRPVGTGPFRLVSWEPGVQLVLERHRGYRDPARPYVDRVVFEEGLKRDAAFMRFRNGEVDIAPRMTTADELLLRREEWRPYTAISPQADVYALIMNTQMAPFDDVHVRRAVAFAVDRERWSRVRNGAIRPAGQLVPPSVTGYDEALPGLQHFDLSRAREEMRLAGHPNGLSEPVTMWTSDSAHGRAYSQLAQADLAKIGIVLELKQVSFPVYLAETGKPQTAQLMSGGWVMDFPDPANIFNIVSGASIAEQDSMNRAFFRDAALDRLLDEARVERDRARRAGMYREANQRVAQAAPWAIFANSQARHAWQPYVRGYKPHPLYWIAVRDAWLDLPRKRVAAVAAMGRRTRLAVLLPLLGRLP